MTNLSIAAALLIITPLAVGILIGWVVCANRKERRRTDAESKD